MLRGTTKLVNDLSLAILVNDVALAIETALPFSTSGKSGWDDVTPERKKMCVAASRAAIEVVRRAAQDSQMASLARKLKHSLDRNKE